MEIEGQLNSAERQLITDAICGADKKPGVVIEVGTWLGGGSTLHILRALERNGTGHLWGIEVDRSIYERMIAAIRAAAPQEANRFTPLFGFSQDVLKQWQQEQPPNIAVDFVFLDGGNNPREQMEEFDLLNPLIPVGGQLMSHDAKVRKGRWLVPYVSRLDNWNPSCRTSVNTVCSKQKKSQPVHLRPPCAQPNGIYLNRCATRWRLPPHTCQHRSVSRPCVCCPGICPAVCQMEDN